MLYHTVYYFVIFMFEDADYGELEKFATVSVFVDGKPQEVGGRGVNNNSKQTN